MFLQSILIGVALLGLPKGLIVEDKVVGKGDPAAAGDLLTVEYTGTLKDGKQFDTSKKRAPFAFRLGEGKVIKGWDEGLVGVKVGGERNLTIPPDLGYGSSDLDDIPANSTLLFNVKVLRIDKKGRKPMVEIEELKDGEGAAVKSGDQVEMHYRGTFLDGKQFDSSYDRGQTFTFKVDTGMVIKGFDMAVTGMKKGGKRKVTIPPELGYGERGAGAAVPPNSTLVFEVEVVSIK